MDFVSDRTSRGQKFRALTVADMFSRKCLGIRIGQSRRGENIVQALQQIAYERGQPQRVHCDNGSEVTELSMDLRAHANEVVLEFSRPREPNDNAFIESFNGSLRDECLNVYWFADLK